MSAACVSQGAPGVIQTQGDEMCVSKMLPVVREILNAESATGLVGCVSPWTPVTGVDTVRLMWSIRALSGGMSVEPVIQYAKIRTDRPGDWSTISGATALTANGDATLDIDSSTLSQQMFFFRVGLQYTNNGGNGHGDCRLGVSYHCVGETVARKTLELESVSSGTRYQPITEVLPTVGISKAKLAFLLTGGAAMGIGLAYRTFTADDEEGSGWTNLGSMVSPTSYAYFEGMINDVAMTLTGKMYFQLAIRYDDDGQAADGYGTVTVLAATRS